VLSDGFKGSSRAKGIAVIELVECLLQKSIV
jgi:hypothetical protein